MICLNSLETAAYFGKALAEALRDHPMPVLMRGELGSGKTTLAGLIVNALPGAENAIPGSPSFNICNRYPVSPEVLHCDLYRCKSDIPEEIETALFSPQIITLVEWAEWLPQKMRPRNFLDISFSVRNNARLVDINAYGPEAEIALSSLLSRFSQIRNNRVPKRY